MPALKPATIGQKLLTDCGQNRPLTTILQERQMTKYALWKRLDSMSYQNFNAIVTNKTSKISFDTLDKFSKALDIPVGDLFEQYEDEI